MSDIKAVAVFCGASPGHAPDFMREVAALGRGLAEAGMTLIYGGGHVGLMGAAADAAVAAGGRVIGVIPEFLRRREVAHDGLAELIVTDSMHTRKRRMFELADAFVAFPGGLGTLDETFEILTWAQLRLHSKPIVICDIAGYAQPMLAMIEAAVAAGFAQPTIHDLYAVADGVAAVMQRLRRSAAAPSDAAALL